MSWDRSMIHGDKSGSTRRDTKEEAKRSGKKVNNTHGTRPATVYTSWNVSRREQERDL